MCKDTKDYEIHLKKHHTEMLCECGVPTSWSEHHLITQPGIPALNDLHTAYTPMEKVFDSLI